MAKPKRMDQIQAVLRNYLSNGSIKATARQLKISKNTVREYVRRAQAHNPDLSKILELNEAEFHDALQAPCGAQKDDRLAVFEQHLDYWVK